METQGCVFDVDSQGRVFHESHTGYSKKSRFEYFDY